MSKGVGNNFPGVPDHLQTDEPYQELAGVNWILPNDVVPGNNQVEPKNITLNQINAQGESEDFFDEKLDEELRAEAKSSSLEKMAWDDEVSETRHSPRNEQLLAAAQSSNMSDGDDPQSIDHHQKPEVQLSSWPLNFLMVEKSGPLIPEQMARDEQDSPALNKKSELAHVPPGATASFVGPPASQRYENAPDFVASAGSSPLPIGSSYGGSPASQSYENAPPGSPWPTSRSYCSSVSSECGSASYIGSGPLTREGAARAGSSECVVSASDGKIPRVRRCSRRHSFSVEGIPGQMQTRCSKKEMKALSAKERKERKMSQNAINARLYKERNEAELKELRELRVCLKAEAEVLEQTVSELWDRTDPQHRDELSYRRKEIAETIASEYKEPLAEKQKNVSDCLEKLVEIKSKRQFLKTKAEISTNGSQKHRENKNLEKAKTDLKIYELEETIEFEKKFLELLKNFVGPSWSPRSPEVTDSCNSNSAPAPYWQNPRMDDYAGNLSPGNNAFDDNGAISQAEPPALESFTQLDISTSYPQSGRVGGTSLAPCWPPISANRVDDEEVVQYHPP